MRPKRIRTALFRQIGAPNRSETTVVARAVVQCTVWMLIALIDLSSSGPILQSAFRPVKVVQMTSRAPEVHDRDHDAATENRRPRRACGAAIRSQESSVRSKYFSWLLTRSTCCGHAQPRWLSLIPVLQPFRIQSTGTHIA